MSAADEGDLEAEFWERYDKAEPTDAAWLIAESFQAWRGLDRDGKPLKAPTAPTAANPFKQRGEGPVWDHMGREFASTTAMRKFYGCPLGAFWERRKAGWSLEEALTGRRKNERQKRPGIGHRV